MKNRSIIDVSLDQEVHEVFFPEIYIHAAVFVVESWRDLSVDIPELSEVGSNRTILDTISRSIAYAEIGGESKVTKESFEKGIRDALYGRIRARGGDSFLRNEEIVREFLQGNFDISVERGFRIYWCTFFKKDLNSSVSRAEKLVRSMDSGDIPKSGDGDLLRNFIKKMEMHPGPVSDDERVRMVVSVMNTMKDLGCTE
jgi:hypothetical protein